MKLGITRITLSEGNIMKMEKLISSFTYNLKPFTKSKSTHYYDSGQVKHLIKFKKDTGEKESAFNYYENGQVKTSASYKYKYYNTDVDHESVVEVKWI